MTPAVPDRDDLASATRDDFASEGRERFASDGRERFASGGRDSSWSRRGDRRRAVENWTSAAPAIVSFARGRHRAERVVSTASSRSALSRFSPVVAGPSTARAASISAAEPGLPGVREDLPVAGRGLPAAGPELGREIRWAARRRRSFTAFGTLGAVGALAVPLPVNAAPARCEQAERYAAQSGSQILRFNAVGDASSTGPVVHVGDAKSAMVGVAKVNSAAGVRMLDAKDDGTAEGRTEVLQQQAPPTNKTAAKRSTHGTNVGPISIGDGQLTTHARWEPGMACGKTDGEVTRATARLRDAEVVAQGDVAVVRVPKVESRSVTELELNGKAAASVATASLSASKVELLDGAVTVKILEVPLLRASMSTQDGGEVRYIPAVVEVTGDGVETARLDTAGDRVEITMKADGSVSDDASGSGSDATSGSAPEGSGSEGGKLLGVGGGASLPDVPDVPGIVEPTTESAPAAGNGMTVTVALGNVRQASRDHAIAARAAAVSVTIAESETGTRTKPGYAPGRVVDFDVGVMEAAAVAPEPVDGAASGGVSDVLAGSGGGLPITGPAVNVVALGGLTLLVAGAVAVFLGGRGRSRN